MFDLVVMILTLLCGVLVVYHHLGYPLILRWAERNKPEQAEPNPHNRGYEPSSSDTELPSISLIIPAYNEERWIADKIRNLAILDYPATHLKVVIACDGCSDNTVEVARQAAAEPECVDLDVEVRDFKDNRGKVAVINEVVASLDSDLVALSDVSALISVDALMIAAAHFRSPELGVLTGHYQLLQPGSQGEEAYWQYQSRIKARESLLGSTLGAHGAFYLFRRELFKPLPADTINDDFILPMEIVAQGLKSHYEPRIHAIELEEASLDMDHQRRRRIAAGNMQQLIRLRQLLGPRFGGVAFTFASGKGLRVLMPFLMLGLLLGSLILARHYGLFALLAGAQVIVYGLAAWQLLWPPRHSPKLMQVLGYLVGGHLAGLIGALRYLLGLERGRWKRVG